jgi:arsenate reductase-like glutaredoxin family protein
MTMAKMVVYQKPTYRRWKLADRDLSDSEIIDLMVEHPDLIQRPIVEKETARSSRGHRSG